MDWSHVTLEVLAAIHECIDTVKKVRKYKDEAVAQAASKLYGKWKVWYARHVCIGSDCLIKHIKGLFGPEVTPVAQADITPSTTTSTTTGTTATNPAPTEQPTAN